MHGMHMGEATREDAPELARLLESVGLSEQSESGDGGAAAALAAWDRMREAVPGAQVLVARRCDASIVAALTVLILPLLGHGGAPSAVMEDVAVHPWMQRSGLGRQMVQRAMVLAHEAGCYKLALSSHDMREGAHAFYERLGFERQGASFSVSLAGLVVVAVAAENEA